VQAAPEKSECFAPTDTKTLVTPVKDDEKACCS